MLAGEPTRTLASMTAAMSVTESHITDDGQVMIWTYGDGSKHSEHRSIGDTSRARVDIACWVREPREHIDPYYVVCCAMCRPIGRRHGVDGHLRAVAVAWFKTLHVALEYAELHSQAHRLARKSFLVQQASAYGRQRRLEEQLG